MIDAHQQVLRLRLLPVVHLVQGSHPAGGDARRAEPVDPVLYRGVRQGRLDAGRQVVTVRDAQGVVSEPHVVGVDAHHRRERPPLGGAGHADLQVGVRAGEEAVGSDGRMVVANRLGHLPRDRPPGSLERVHPHHGGQQARPHDAAATGALTLVEGRQHSDETRHACQQVGDRHADPGRLARVTGKAHEPRLTLGHLVVAGPRALGTVVAEPADRQHHEARVDLVQTLRGEPEPVEDPGTVVLHEDVGPGDELVEQPPSVVAAQVSSDRLLVAVAGQEVGGHRRLRRPDEGRTPRPRVVAVRGLDLDDAGTEVAHRHAGMRTGEGSSEVDDEQSVQRSRHAHRL